MAVVQPRDICQPLSRGRRVYSIGVLLCDDLLGKLQRAGTVAPRNCVAYFLKSHSYALSAAREPNFGTVLYIFPLISAKRHVTTRQCDGNRRNMSSETFPVLLLGDDMSNIVGIFLLESFKFLFKNSFSIYTCKEKATREKESKI